MEPHVTSPEGSALHASEDDNTPDESDPELERDLQALAQWLFEVYLWRLENERVTGDEGPIDKHPPPPNI
ncbi:MAG TPA: hypothetical protein VGG56_11570 [Terracidiphilus sp.]|jgi:hypothetical protein